MSTEGDAGADQARAGRFPDRERLFVVFFFAAYFFLLWQLVRILSPFMAPLLGSVMLALIFYPVHERIGRWIPGPNLGAGVTTVLVLVTSVAPVSILVWLLAREAAAMVPAVRDWLIAHQDLETLLASVHLPAPVQGALRTLRGYLERVEFDLGGVALEAVREAGNRATGFGAALVTRFFAVVLNVIVLLLALFFFLRDGERIVRFVLDLVPMEEGNKRLIVAGLDRTIAAMVRGTVITASAQGFLTGVGLVVAGVPFPVLLGFVATFLAVVPFVGVSLVWVPSALWLFAHDHTFAAVGLALWGGLIVGLIDNVIRPVVVGEHAQLPILLLFLGVLGGIQTYGLIGALVSPLVIACVFAFARIYREQYHPKPAATAAADPPAPAGSPGDG